MKTIKEWENEARGKLMGVEELARAIRDEAFGASIEAIRAEFIDEYGEDDYINRGYGLAVKVIEELKEK